MGYPTGYSDFAQTACTLGTLGFRCNGEDLDFLIFTK
jgi:hypothetical protein